MSKRFLKYETEDVQNGTLPNISSDGVFKSAGGGSSVQTDWNQTDETQPDYIKNKPFGTLYGKEIVNVIALTSTSQDSDGNHIFSYDELPMGNKFRCVGPVDINIDGTLYENIQVSYTDASSYGTYNFETVGLPFSLNIIAYYDYSSILNLTYSGNDYIGQIKIFDRGAQVDKLLDTRYLDMDDLSANYFPRCIGLESASSGHTLVYDAAGKVFRPSYEVYLKSSTSGSMKKFKLTVDDSGTLSATEVTT